MCCLLRQIIKPPTFATRQQVTTPSRILLIKYVQCSFKYEVRSENNMRYFIILRINILLSRIIKDIEQKTSLKKLTDRFILRDTNGECLLLVFFWWFDVPLLLSYDTRSYFLSFSDISSYVIFRNRILNF